MGPMPTSTYARSHSSRPAHADVVSPSEAYAEKEGTVTHPDGRLQRVRQAVAHAGARREELGVLVTLATLLGHDLGVRSAREPSERVFEAVPFSAPLTLED